jgi:hypothetical protein
MVLEGQCTGEAFFGAKKGFFKPCLASKNKFDNKVSKRSFLWSIA